MSLTDKDLKNIAQTVDQVTRPQFQELSTRVGGVEKNLNRLTSSMDQVVRIVRRHEQEWLVLRAQHEKIRDILVKKGIATEDELAVA